MAQHMKKKPTNGQAALRGTGDTCEGVGEVHARSLTIAKRCGQKLPTVPKPGFVVAPDRMFHSVVNGTPESLDSATSCEWPSSFRASATCWMVGR
jgi:hypothetical protein